VSVIYDFHDKTAFVTGAASGIGRATALAFARAGARVALADLSGDGLCQTARLIDAAGGDALAITCDVTSEDDVQAAVDRTVERFGSLDAAFNNAGVEQPVQPAADTAKTDWDRILGVSLTGAFLCTRAQVRQMLRQDGGVGGLALEALDAGSGGDVDDRPAAVRTAAGRSSTSPPEPASRASRARPPTPPPSTGSSASPVLPPSTTPHRASASTPSAPGSSTPR
jgi:NAD(P)-dependent dehydrogenase (short-subunit alcohol dehydrogenase family)